MSNTTADTYRGLDIYEITSLIFNDNSLNIPSDISFLDILEELQAIESSDSPNLKVLPSIFKDTDNPVVALDNYLIGIGKIQPEEIPIQETTDTPIEELPLVFDPEKQRDPEEGLVKGKLSDISVIGTYLAYCIHILNTEGELPEKDIQIADIIATRLNVLNNS